MNLKDKVNLFVSVYKAEEITQQGFLAKLEDLLLIGEVNDVLENLPDDLRDEFIESLKEGYSDLSRKDEDFLGMTTSPEETITIVRKIRAWLKSREG